MAKKQSTASKEGYAVLTDADLKAGVENRIRQLEGELATHRMLSAEAAADPDDDVSEEAHDKAAAALEARLSVTRARLAALKENMGAEPAAPPQS